MRGMSRKFREIVYLKKEDGESKEDFVARKSKIFESNQIKEAADVTSLSGIDGVAFRVVLGDKHTFYFDWEAAKKQVLLKGVLGSNVKLSRNEARSLESASFGRIKSRDWKNERKKERKKSGVRKYSAVEDIPLHAKAYRGNWNAAKNGFVDLFNFVDDIVKNSDELKQLNRVPRLKAIKTSKPKPTKPTAAKKKASSKKTPKTSKNKSKSKPKSKDRKSKRTSSKDTETRNVEAERRRREEMDREASEHYAQAVDPSEIEDDDEEFDEFDDICEEEEIDLDDNFYDDDD